MKKIRFFTFISFFIFLSVNEITAASESQAVISASIQKEFPAFANLTVEEFFDLTPRKIKNKTGQRLTWKQIIALKAAQKKIKKSIKKGMPGSSGKSQVTALMLALFLGFWGVHRFYLGDPVMGFVMLLTLGGCGILFLIDIIMIATGDLQPKNGPYEETLD